MEGSPEAPTPGPDMARTMGWLMENPQVKHTLDRLQLQHPSMHVKLFVLPESALHINPALAELPRLGVGVKLHSDHAGPSLAVLADGSVLDLRDYPAEPGQ